MINIEDMNSLFRLISRNLKKDITCYAFGGNAMMYCGYKTTTKDIDIIFEDKESLDEFIRSLKLLGYTKMSLMKIYIPELTKEKDKPVMFSKGDERFDLFLKQVFQTKLSPAMKDRLHARFDYMEKDNTLTVNVLGKHDIILMKSITQRERDFDDVRTIAEKDDIDWKVIVDEAIWQAKHGDKWVILDLEETLQRLKEHVLIKKEHFSRLHKAV